MAFKMTTYVSGNVLHFTRAPMVSCWRCWNDRALDFMFFHSRFPETAQCIESVLLPSDGFPELLASSTLLPFLTLLLFIAGWIIGSQGQQQGQLLNADWQLARCGDCHLVMPGLDSTARVYLIQAEAANSSLRAEAKLVNRSVPPGSQTGSQV